MNKLIEKVRNYPFSCLVIVGIWTVCMIPVPETPLDEISFIDKWTHFVMYGTLTVTIWLEYIFRHRKSGLFRWKSLLFWGMICPMMMGGLVELAQAYLTTYRSGDWFDALCNSLGVLLGCLIGTQVARFRATGDKD